MLKKSESGRRPLTTAFALTVFMSLLALGSFVFGQQNPRFVTIGTASPAGAYYPLGVKMADIWNRTIPGTHFSARQTGGSIANMNLLSSGQIEVGFANENIAYAATHGKAPFSHKIHVNGGWILNESLGVFVVLRNSGLHSVADLRGKRVSLGSAGSSANSLGKLILNAEGLPPDSYKPVYLGWQQSANALKDHLIDAAFMIGGQPFPAISSLSVTTKIRLLKFSVQTVRNYSNYPYASATIPQSMYNLESNGDAIAVRSIVYLSPKLPAALVKKMVAEVFQNIPALKAAQASGAEAKLLSPSAAKQLGLTVQPGVVQYAKAQGKWK